jgi:EF-hand domain pair
MSDENGDGVISLEEMIKYLTSVYRVIYETVPGTAEQLGVSPEELASATAQRCFEEADVNGDGSLTLEEFKEWFLLNDSALPDGPVNCHSLSLSSLDVQLWILYAVYAATPTKAPSSGTTLPKGDNSPGRAAADYFEDVEGDSDSGVDSDDDHTALPPAKVIRAALKLDKFSIREVYDTFEEQAEEGPYLSLSSVLFVDLLPHCFLITQVCWIAQRSCVGLSC